MAMPESETITKIKQMADTLFKQAVTLAAHEPKDLLPAAEASKQNRRSRWQNRLLWLNRLSCPRPTIIFSAKIRPKNKENRQATGPRRLMIPPLYAGTFPSWRKKSTASPWSGWTMRPQPKNPWSSLMP